MDPKIAKKIASLIAEKLDQVYFNPKDKDPLAGLVARAAGDYNSGQVSFPISVISIYGTGAYAIVLKIEDAKGKNFAMRVGPFDEGTFDLHQTLAKYEMAPRIHYKGKLASNKQYSFIIMDNISGTLNTYLRSKFDADKLMLAIDCLLDKKTLLNVVHGDMHTENIVILKDGSTLGFIDFEFSFVTDRTRLTVLDFIPLLGSLKYADLFVFDEKKVGRFSKTALQALIALIVRYYQEKFNIDINMNQVRERKNGGYAYKKKLTSYLKLGGDFSEAELVQTEESLMKEFPSLVVPKVVP